MPSFELEPFVVNNSLRIVGAAEIILPTSLRVMFWVIDPEQQVIWPSADDNLASCLSDLEDQDQLGYARRHYLWQQTCFELFVGIKDKTVYREINLSTAERWNCYQFENYRQPANMPPVVAHDIVLLELKTQVQKLEAILNFQQFFEQQQCGWDDLVLGISSIVKTNKNNELYFALQHSGVEANFHRKVDWTLRL